MGNKVSSADVELAAKKVELNPDLKELAKFEEGTLAWYRLAYQLCKIDPGYESAVASNAKLVLAGRKRYEKVEAATKVPWWVIGCIHFKEATCSFAGVLHNGEKIIGTGKKTRIVPANRGPFSTWEEAAIDAITMNGSRWEKLRAGSRDIGEILYACERYNGTGYLTGSGKAETTPYLWARTNINDDFGVYVADGKFDPKATTQKTSGIAALLKELERMGEINLGSGVEPMPKPVEPAPQIPDSVILITLAQRAGVSPAAVERLIAFRDSKRPDSRPRHWAVFDVSLHSSKKRLFVFDVKEQAVKQYLCAHGKGSDQDNNGMAEKFSNEGGSLCTSLGIYICAETQQCDTHGYEMKLDGMESTNSKARERLVVMHKASYVTDSHVGRSSGCPAVREQDHREIIDALKGGSLLIIHR